MMSAAHNTTPLVDNPAEEIEKMEALRSLFPTADALLAVSREDLASVLLRLARARVQGVGFWPDSILNERTSLLESQIPATRITKRPRSRRM
jgi:hypothetical protein